MAKYVYPAIFMPEGKWYNVQFPDIDGCYTCGDSLADAIEMAQDALAIAMYGKEERKEPIPTPSQTLDVPEGCFSNLIACDTAYYHRRYNKRSVRKTLTIPQWLDIIATENNANFSQDLQEILKAKYVRGENRPGHPFMSV